jgi:hypothetical protein
MSCFPVLFGTWASNSEVKMNTSPTMISITKTSSSFLFECGIHFLHMSWSLRHFAPLIEPLPIRQRPDTYDAHNSCRRFRSTSEFRAPNRGSNVTSPQTDTPRWTPRVKYSLFSSQFYTTIPLCVQTSLGNVSNVSQKHFCLMRMWLIITVLAMAMWNLVVIIIVNCEEAHLWIYLPGWNCTKFVCVLEHLLKPCLV